MPKCCHFCKFRTDNYDDLHEHYYESHKARFSCQFCHRLFRGKQEASKHVRKSHYTGPYACFFCGHKSHTKELFAAHHKLQHTEMLKKLTCPKCNYLKHSDKGLQMHMEQQHSTVSVHQRYLQEALSTTKGGLSAPLTMHEKDGLASRVNLWCPICAVEFLNLEMMFEHCVEQHDCGVFCQYCGWIGPFGENALESKNVLGQHWGSLAHPSEGDPMTWPCPFCAFGNKRKIKTYEHIRSNHPREFANAVCLMCETVFPSAHCLTLHVEHVHKARADLLCTHCWDRFERDILVEHYMTEEVSKDPVYCAECGLKMELVEPELSQHIEKCSYLEHLRLARQPSCEKCSWKAETKEALRLHKVKFHNLIKCLECQQTFFGSLKLNEHSIAAHDTPYLNEKGEPLIPVEIVPETNYSGSHWKEKHRQAGKEKRSGNTDFRAGGTSIQMDTPAPANKLPTVNLTSLVHSPQKPSPNLGKSIALAAYAKTLAVSRPMAGRKGAHLPPEIRAVKEALKMLPPELRNSAKHLPPELRSMHAQFNFSTPPPSYLLPDVKPKLDELDTKPDVDGDESKTVAPALLTVDLLKSIITKVGKLGSTGSGGLKVKDEPMDEGFANAEASKEKSSSVPVATSTQASTLVSSGDAPTPAVGAESAATSTGRASLEEVQAAFAVKEEPIDDDYEATYCSQPIISSTTAQPVVIPMIAPIHLPAALSFQLPSATTISSLVTAANALVTNAVSGSDNVVVAPVSLPATAHPTFAPSSRSTISSATGLSAQPPIAPPLLPAIDLSEKSPKLGKSKRTSATASNMPNITTSEKFRNAASTSVGISTVSTVTTGMSGAVSRTTHQPQYEATSIPDANSVVAFAPSAASAVTLPPTFAPGPASMESTATAVVMPSDPRRKAMPRKPKSEMMQRMISNPDDGENDSESTAAATDDSSGTVTDEPEKAPPAATTYSESVSGRTTDGYYDQSAFLQSNDAITIARTNSNQLSAASMQQSTPPHVQGAAYFVSGRAGYQNLLPPRAVPIQPPNSTDSAILPCSSNQSSTASMFQSTPPHVQSAAYFGSAPPPQAGFPHLLPPRGLPIQPPPSVSGHPIPPPNPMQFPMNNRPPAAYPHPPIQVGKDFDAGGIRPPVTTPGEYQARLSISDSSAHPIGNPLDPRKRPIYQSVTTAAAIKNEILANATESVESAQYGEDWGSDQAPYRQQQQPPRAPDAASRSYNSSVVQQVQQEPGPSRYPYPYPQAPRSYAAQEAPFVAPDRPPRMEHPNIHSSPHNHDGINYDSYRPPFPHNNRNNYQPTSMEAPKSLFSNVQQQEIEVKEEIDDPGYAVNTGGGGYMNPPQLPGNMHRPHYDGPDSSSFGMYDDPFESLPPHAPFPQKKPTGPRSGHHPPSLLDGILGGPGHPVKKPNNRKEPVGNNRPPRVPSRQQPTPPLQQGVASGGRPRSLLAPYIATSETEGASKTGAQERGGSNLLSRSSNSRGSLQNNNHGDGPHESEFGEQDGSRDPRYRVPKRARFN